MTLIAPAAFVAYRQFMLWRLVYLPGKPKPTKVPVHPVTGAVIDAHDSSGWVSYDEAVAAMSRVQCNGVCFVFTASDPFFFLDIDNCREDAGWSQLAQNLCAMFPGAYIEVSQSGNGLHIFGTGTIATHGCKNSRLGLEFYTEKRFVALTGTNAIGDAATACGHVLPDLVARFFPSDAGGEIGEQNWQDIAADGYTGPADDDELIAKMLGSKSSMGVVLQGKASIADLWNRNVIALASAFPSNDPEKEFEESECDMALMQHLAFWTGKNNARMCRLMFRSGLVRDKWTQHKSYMWRSIVRANARQVNIYSFAAKPKPVNIVEQTAQSATGVQWMTAEAQKQHFTGCVYVQDSHKAFVPNGAMLKPDQFKVTYGGYTFAMDAMNEKTTRNAWEVFTESQAVRYPKVNSTCFRPELQAGTIIETEGRLLLNTYVPIHTRRMAGDPQRFLTHLHKLFPITMDREIMVAYMAAVVQYPGKKFQWWPVLQGAEGNGKTLFTRVLSHCVGHRYTHLPNAQQLGSGGSVFTGWLHEKLFIGIEEITLADHDDILDALKPIITNDRVEIQKKGVDQVTGDNRANGIMNANKKGAVSVGYDKRRYAVFFTPQQSQKDCIRDGMDSAYFSKLYDWLNEDGYAIVNEFLHTYAIPDELNPATSLQRAPETSSTAEMHSLSLGKIEQEINEAIESGRYGFAGGWISSLEIEKLFFEKRLKSPAHRQRRDLMNSLGYDWHPGLLNGRANNKILLEGGKPVLFIREGHPALAMKHPPHIVETYIKAQQVIESAFVGDNVVAIKNPA